MDEEHISKKELLEQTGISYGQLYRWKRERLIPEEWFIKQSAFTGQETYFPREQVLTRVQAILNLKDTHSLEDMSRIFSPEPGSAIAVADLVGFDPLNKELLFALGEQGGGSTAYYSSGEVVFLAALSPYVGKGGFGADIAARLASSVFKAAGKRVPTSASCILFRVGDEGSFHVVLCSGATSPLFDEKVVVIGALELARNAELLGSYLQTINQKA
ncbi:MAG: YhbD family protein [Coriobacteriales bacterium]|jgi:hypothetical protein|nr:YhbD family protein [Coriobacteriales bacterium]